ncbi:MAG: GntR family transcriptional regulator, partial [Allobaculum sp.]|nr:GntR family transcriptional regulator [Allobaculum sp.]
MEFHFTNDAPLYLQLASLLETQIIAGHLEPGQKLPSVRELALMSKTNPNTVAKALTQLEQKGLIETRRTSG